MFGEGTCLVELRRGTLLRGPVLRRTRCQLSASTTFGGRLWAAARKLGSADQSTGSSDQSTVSAEQFTDQQTWEGMVDRKKESTSGGAAAAKVNPGQHTSQLFQKTT